MKFRVTLEIEVESDDGPIFTPHSALSLVTEHLQDQGGVLEQLAEGLFEAFSDADFTAYGVGVRVIGSVEISP